MTTADLTSAQLVHLITHHVGNKSQEENLVLSDTFSSFDEATEALLYKYLLHPFKTEEIYRFYHPVSIDMNEVNILCREIFANLNSFRENSRNMATLLYDHSVHPRIKAGELNVAYFENIDYNGEHLSAIGIFKSESDVPFLKMRSATDRFAIDHDFGFETKGVDKGCLVLNTGKDTGYEILVIDNTKTVDAQYWKDEFLRIHITSNEFVQTNQFLQITKQFVTKQLNEEFDISKADQVDILKRSVDYFKNHDHFEKEDFEKEVLYHDNMIESFRKFGDAYREDHDVKLNDQFAISPSAVKKQARIFRNIIKLDKNFHIYIHGDKNMIEQGVEADGRKYYKIYYREETLS